jgi:hypothetical protein
MTYGYNRSNHDALKGDGEARPEEEAPKDEHKSVENGNVLLSVDTNGRMMCNKSLVLLFVAAVRLWY